MVLNVCSIFFRHSLPPWCLLRRWKYCTHQLQRCTRRWYHGHRNLWVTQRLHSTGTAITPSSAPLHYCFDSFVLDLSSHHSINVSLCPCISLPGWLLWANGAGSGLFIVCVLARCLRIPCSPAMI
jgi:hypothetical protein